MRKPFAVALTIVVLLHLLGLGRAHLLEPDEGRYADVARGFADGGSLVVPRSNGVPFLDKPPLVCWLGAASLRALGTRDPFALRLVPAAFGILAALVAAAMARSAYGRGGWVALLVYGTAPLALGVGRTFTLDVPLAALTGLGVLLVLKQTPSPREAGGGLGWGALGGLPLGLATLVKGPVALFLAGLAVLCALLITRSRRLWSPLPFLVALAIAAPWYVLLCQEVPDFARAFFWEENLRRFAGPPTEHAHGPFFFLGTLAWGLGPAALAGLVLLGTRPTLPERARVLLAWAGLTVLFFSLSRTKVETYILPAFLPLAAVIGAEIDLAIEERSGPIWRGLKTVFLVACAASLLLAAGFLAFAFGLPIGSELDAIARNAIAPQLVVLPVVGVAFALLAARAGLPRAALLALAGSFVLWLPVLLGPLSAVSAWRSSEPIAQLIEENRREGTPVASYRFYYRGLPYFLGEPVTLLGELNEMRPESFAARPDLYMPDLYFTYGKGVIVDDCWTRSFLAWKRPLVVMPEGQRRPDRFIDTCNRAGLKWNYLGKVGEDMLFRVEGDQPPR
ncbi:MAG TPA: glycosyltransferase family 39 protein [Planctomycetota bacterium]|nr:glycosyltransferase family 39 protein [Planctomycetota bacterium]